MTHQTRKAAEQHLAAAGYAKGKGGRWTNTETKSVATIGPTTKDGCRIFYGNA